MKKNLYRELKEKIQKEVNSFPMMFAFSQEQFDKGLEKLDIKREEVKEKLLSIGAGGYIRKADKENFKAMLKKHEELKQQAIKDDATGEGYIKDMFISEMNNHEYGYTYDISDTLDALNLTMEEINSKENLKHGFELAREEYLSMCEEY